MLTSSLNRISIENKSTSFQSIGVFFVYGATFFSFFPYIRAPQIFFTLADLLFLLSAVFLMLGKRNEYITKSKIPSSVIFGWVFSSCLIMTGLALSTIINGDPNRGLIVVIQYSFTLFLVPFVYSQLSFEELKNSARFGIAGVTIVCLFGIIMYYFFAQYARPFTMGGRMGSFLENPNSLSKTISIFIPLLMMFSHYKYVRKWTALIGLFCMIGGLLVASSFGGLLAAVLSLALFLLLSLNLKMIMQTLLAVGFIIIIGMNITLPEIFESRIMSYFNSSGQTSSVGSFDDRSYLNYEALEEIKKHPFIGIGADSFEKLTAFQLPVHNTYLNFWVEGGFISLIGLVIFLIIILLYAIKVWRLNKTVGAAAISMSITLISNCMTITHIYARFWVVPMILMVLLVRFYVNQEKQQER
ncbi:O-antigen ligase family protein [Paenibacillus chitinolyticus]|uniref:O-antigen ligase family protein n=1 Tax=Paenibacillus chitinolyticus TaxID=79263 RepID=UPI0038652B71